MMRNDYRRSLILLRSNASGYSGHVRLERRTLMGTMYFLVQSPGDCPALRAALVGRGRDGSCYACALGELQQDARGQAVLGYSFDPRDICKRELEQYQLIAITCAGDASCQVVLFGNVCGHAEMNWEAVRSALCALYAGEQPEPAAPQGVPEASAQAAPVTELPTEAAANEAPAAGSRSAAAPRAEALPEAAAQVAPEPAQGEQYGEGAQYVASAPQAGMAAQQYSEGDSASAAQYDASTQQSGAAVQQYIGSDSASASEYGAGASQSGASGGDSAGEALACDLLEAQGVPSSAPWPEPAEALRALFQSEPALTDAPDDQCVYVEAPMPEGSGFPFVAAGLLILGGALAAIRYALPATWTEEPPAGLEDCAWIGNQNKGWWVTEVPVAGGAGSHLLRR